MSDITPGPMEKELRRTLPAPHCAECRVEKERIIGMAREQDAIRAEMLAALEAHMVGEWVEGRPPVHHTSNCGYWATNDESACWHSCKLTRAAIAKAKGTPNARGEAVAS